MANAIQSAGAFLNTGSGPTNPPTTQTASAHSVTIRNAQGLKVGRIQQWNMQLSRVTDQVWEIDQNTKGLPHELTPQIQATNIIQVQRYELYTKFMGQAFGANLLGGVADMYSLSQQVTPFSVRETYVYPSGTIKAYLYSGCYFTEYGRTISATDDRIVKAQATIWFATVVPLN